MWKQIYGSGADMIGWQLISTADGGFALLGKRKLNDLSRWDVLLLKLNSTGKLEWAKTYFGYFGDQKGQIVQTKDGGFVMTAVLSDLNLVLLRVNRSGNLVWTRAHEEIFAYPNGLFPIGGGLYVSTIEESGELVLLQFGGGGKILKKKRFRSVPGTSLIGAYFISDNGFILSGRFNLPDGRENMFLARLDKNWNVIWTKTFMGKIDKPFGALLGRLEINDVKQNGADSITVACQIFFPLKVPKTLLLQISLSGKVLDARWFDAEGDSTPNLILPLEQGEILIVGPSFNTPSFGNPSGFLLKLDSAGDLPGCFFFQDLAAMELDAPPVESVKDIHLIPVSLPSFDVVIPELQINTPSINGVTICK
jgi:hypothetical protein